MVGKSGHLGILGEAGGAVFLAALLVEPHPSAALHKVVLDPHRNRRSHPCLGAPRDFGSVSDLLF